MKGPAKSTNPEVTPASSIGGLHVAVIMDGNGRWATRRGLPRPTGHKAGAEAVRKVTTAAPRLGVRTLTLYAFSSDNWRRPSSEVSRLMKLFAAALRRELPRCLDNGVRLSVIGRRDRLPGRLPELIEEAECLTRSCTNLHLRVAVDYSAREVLTRAARLCSVTPGDPSTDFNVAVARAQNELAPVPPVDLLIRTGGEQRLSDFLLWELAYAELFFSQVLWPDFGADELSEAISEFHSRNRRFGGLSLIASA